MFFLVTPTKLHIYFVTTCVSAAKLTKTGKKRWLCPYVFLSPAFQIGFGEEVGVEDGFLRALATLLLEVLQQTEGVAAQQADGDEVEDGHQSHCEVNDAPCLLQLQEAAHQHHNSAYQEECIDSPGLAGDEADICLSVEVVGDDGQTLPT